MTTNISRRELLAWLAAGAGAAATGATVLQRSGDTPLDASLDGPTPSSTRSTTSTTRAVSPSSPVESVAPSTVETGQRLLVVVEMPGGNDGLSMAVPYGDGTYFDRRPNTAIAEADVLDLDGSIGLHPELVGLHGRGVTLVEGVGSTSPDGSHFEMQQRWWAGSSTSADAASGWIGRLADVLADGGAPAALSVGTGSHPIIASATGSTLSMPSADALWAVAGADEDDRLRTTYQRTLRSFADGEQPLASVLRGGLDFADRMIELGLDDDEAADLGYEGWGLGRSLQFAASVLAGDVGVRVVHVQMDGDFDTHEGHDWKHPELMRKLDANLVAFHRDLEARALDDRVLVMTTSEFGRTLQENDSSGLDHGAASTMMLSGPIPPGRCGESPSLTKLDDNDDLVAKVPVESYLGSVTEGWLGVPADDIFDGSTDTLDLFDD